MPQKRRERLARESNEFGERAGQLHLDGYQEQALDASTRAVNAHEQLYDATPEDPEVVEAYADRLRTRADIRRELGMSLEVQGAISRALEQYRAGVVDAQRALELYESTFHGEGNLLSLWIPGIQMALAEFHGWSGSHEEAQQLADAAIAGYRDWLDVADELSTLDFAQALSRYADLLDFLGLAEPALTARRESVEMYRTRLGRDGVLWSMRHSRGTTWVTTPTLERFCRTAYYLAIYQEPPNQSAAPEALLALQDAAEGFADLLSNLPFAVDETARDRVAHLSDTTHAMERWLEALGEADLAARYSAAFRAVVEHHDSERAAPIRTLRPLLDRVVRRHQG